MASQNTDLSYMRTVGFPPIPVLSLSTFVDLLKIQGSDRNNSILPKLSISSSSSLLCETELLVASPKTRRKINSIAPLYPSLWSPLSQWRDQSATLNPYQVHTKHLTHFCFLILLCIFSVSSHTIVIILLTEDIGLSSIQCDDRFALTGDLEAELDEDQSINETIGLTAGEKKRRLGLDQVRALERHFEVENKLDPDRKTKLAQELGLQPRQVAIWFQNRRARSKTKQLERNFNELKSRHDDILIECESLRRDRDALSAQVFFFVSLNQILQSTHHLSIKWISVNWMNIYIWRILWWFVLTVFWTAWSQRWNLKAKLYLQILLDFMKYGSFVFI